MDRKTKWLFGAVSALCVMGCGGTSNSPLLGTGQSPRIRALDLITNSPTLTAQYDSAANPIGTVIANQVTAYATEGEGNNTVSFLNAGNTIASDNMVYQYSDYYTVSVYSNNGQYGTFALADNNIALNNGTSQIRVADAITGQGGNVDVYVTAGSSNSPTLIAANLISAVNGGLAFANGTAYKSETPGQFTVTVTPTGVPGTILLNQVVSLNGGQSITVYALAGSTSTTTTDDEGG